MNVQLVPIDSVNPSAYNPRKADPRRLDIVELSLRKLGFVLPIYADSNGEILSGHQRHHVAKRMGLTQIPVSYTRPMDLAERKAVNIVFNRGTNDLSLADTPKSITEALARIDLAALSAAVPDRLPAEMWACTHAERVPIHPLIRANSGRWVKYSCNTARTLARKGIHMPIVATRDGHVVNGIGRLQMLAEKKSDCADVVWISDEQAQLADAMLNLLSMDFDIHTRYADQLRYNSFRRARRVRSELGRGFVFAMIGNKPTREINMTDKADARRWRKFYGTSVVDFGAGHLHEADMLRAAGVSVAAFEPFRLGDNGEIDKAASVELAREFLAEISSGRQFHSVFISSVLNSVPFVDDRRAIVCVCAALCGEQSRLYSVASSVSQVGARQLAGKEFLNENSSKHIGFGLDYEPNIKIGDFQDKPKIQKYHSRREFYELFAEHFAVARVSEGINNVQAVCGLPRKTDESKLRSALEFEFDLPYPDGSRMGLAGAAKAAFSARLGVRL